MQTTTTASSQSGRPPRLTGRPGQGLLPAERAFGLDGRARRVIVFLENNFQRELSLSQMARVVGLSPSRLRHLFKTQTGTTPTQFLKNLRMRKAKGLLETTRLSVKEVMAHVGVNDPSNFTRDFKRAYGLTPIQIRNRPRVAVLPLLWAFAPSPGRRNAPPRRCSPER